jgi:hypothetical protein
MKPPFLLWMAGGVLPGLLATGGLYALAQFQYGETQPLFFLCVFLMAVLWISCLTLFISLLCLIASTIFNPHNRQEPATGTELLAKTEEARFVDALSLAGSK